MRNALRRFTAVALAVGFAAALAAAPAVACDGKSKADSQTSSSGK